MKTRTLICLLLLIVAALCGLPQPAKAATYHDFLRLNKIYVLYTAPIVPHTDKQGNFWVGLNSFAALLEAKVQPTASPQSVMVTCRGHTLTLTAGAKQAVLPRPSVPRANTG